jgi:CRISPR system Cascade subunit CasD
MSVVALRLAGPLQSWGVDSRFVRRGTQTAPTKSGVIGLVAAAKGIRRTEPIEELVSLRLGVRVDQPGQLIRDFQTAQRPEKGRDGSVKWKSLPLSYRYYISDATYLVVLEGDRSLVEGIDSAVRSPAFPLYLGRRSCPPAGPVALGVSEIDLDEALNTLPWLASDRHQRSQRERSVRLETIRDALADEVGAETLHDEPVSFDPDHRRYTWRSIVHGAVVVDNPHGVEAVARQHDPMSALGG